eukprot:783369-Rhodomonas_salina.2
MRRRGKTYLDFSLRTCAAGCGRQQQRRQRPNRAARPSQGAPLSACRDARRLACRDDPRWGGHGEAKR